MGGMLRLGLDGKCHHVLRRLSIFILHVAAFLSENMLTGY